MALAIYFVIYLMVAFVWRSYVVYRHTGKNPVVLSSADDAYGYVGRAFKVAILSIAILLLGHALWPSGLIWLAPFVALETTAFFYAGWFLLITSLLWIWVAQVQMGDSWRVGIDSHHRTALVSKGLFAVSRNPIFLSMRVTMLGLFFVFPNGITLAVLATTEVLIQVQVRLEETYLSALHGEAYQQYCVKVRRWI